MSRSVFGTMSRRRLLAGLPLMAIPARESRPARTQTPIQFSSLPAAITVEIIFPGGSPAGGTLFYSINDGKDLGAFVAPTARFTQRCVRARNPTLANFFVDFRPDSDGSRIEIVFWNGEAGGKISSGYVRNLPSYRAVIKKSGSIIHIETVPFHYWGQRWRYQSSPRRVVRSVAQVFSDGFLPHMSQGAARIVGNNRSAGRSWSGRPYDGIIIPPVPVWQPKYKTFMTPDNPGANTKLGLQCAVDTGGERDEIGLLTEWQADWLLRGTQSSFNTMMQQAEMCGGDWAWYVTDTDTDAPINYKSDDTHYHFYTLQRRYGAPWIQIGFGHQNGWDIHEADTHVPNVFYVPYALTEDPYFLEGQQFLVQWGTGWAVYERDTRLGSLGRRVVCSYMQEQRSLGWGIRNLACVYKMTPANAPSWLLPNSYYAEVSSDYSLVLNHFYNTNLKPRYAIFHMISEDNYFQAFEQSYAIMGMALADLVGLPTGPNPSWKTHLNFYFGMLDGLTSATSGWNRQCPQVHDVLSGELDALVPATWGAAWEHWKSTLQSNATFPNAPSPGNQQGGSMQNCSQLFAAAACAKSRGVPTATAAKWWLDQFIDYNYPNNDDASMGIPFFAKCGFDGT